MLKIFIWNYLLSKFKKILSTFPLSQRVFSQGFALPEQKVGGDLRTLNVESTFLKLLIPM